MSVLSAEEIAELLKPQIPTGAGHVNSRNTKHVTWHDREMRCASSRCGSPTYIKVLGAPNCMVHTILRLSEMLERLDPQDGKTT